MYCLFLTDVAFGILGFQYFKLLEIGDSVAPFSQYDLAVEKSETLSANFFGLAWLMDF